MNIEDKDYYFELRDKLIKRLPEPEKSIYSHFRQVEKTNLHRNGRLIVDGKSPTQLTADHFMMEEEEIKKTCLNAIRLLKNLAEKH